MSQPQPDDPILLRVVSIAFPIIRARRPDMRQSWEDLTQDVLLNFWRQMDKLAFVARLRVCPEDLGALEELHKYVSSCACNIAGRPPSVYKRHFCPLPTGDILPEAEPAKGVRSWLSESQLQQLLDLLDRRGAAAANDPAPARYRFAMLKLRLVGKEGSKLREIADRYGVYHGNKPGVPDEQKVDRLTKAAAEEVAAAVDSVG